jgi:hypothetical protein
MLQLLIAVILLILFLVGCGNTASTPIAEVPAATSEPEQAAATSTPTPEPTPTLEPPTSTPEPPTVTPTPTSPLPTATPTISIPIPDGLLPSTLTPNFFENLYQQVNSKASLDIPGVNFEDVSVIVHPFEPSPDMINSGATLIVEFNFSNEGSIKRYIYKWTDKTNDLAFIETEKQTIEFGSGLGPCEILPWQRQVGWEELVRYGFSKVHESFPPDANSRYVLFANRERECRWQVSFLHGYYGEMKRLGHFVLNETGPSD